MTSQTPRNILLKEHSMATQTRRTIRRSAKFFSATVKASMVTACCGLILWSAGAAYAAASSNGMPYNGMPWNGMPFNGMPFQGLLMNGTPLNGLPAHEASLPTVQSEHLPWSTLSHQGVGKYQPPDCKGPRCLP
jgi:hypothetical protein